MAFDEENVHGWDMCCKNIVKRTVFKKKVENHWYILLVWNTKYHIISSNLWYLTMYKYVYKRS